MSRLLQGAMKNFLSAICFWITSAAASPAFAAIPAHVLPGALENEVRTALVLIDCNARSRNPKTVDCVTKPTSLSGIVGHYKVTFADGLLIFSQFFFERKHFDAGVGAVGQLLGPANHDESFEIPVLVAGKNAVQRIKAWGSSVLFASVSLYTPGEDDFASIFLLYPPAVPKDVHGSYLPSR